MEETNLYPYNNKIYRVESEKEQKLIQKLLTLQSQLKRKYQYIQWLGLDLRLKGIHTGHLGWSEYRDTYNKYMNIESEIKILKKKLNL